jgi:hypothetical protein
MRPIEATAQRILDFLTSIGLSVRHEMLRTPTVLPGITVDNGVLVVDPDKLSSPGDLLHEAGHLAVLNSVERTAATADLGSDAGYEMGAIAWSWAALCGLGLKPEILFHANGYGGGSSALIENFRAGRYIGVPVLEWKGLAVQAERAAELGVEPYPEMLRWLAD